MFVSMYAYIHTLAASAESGVQWGVQEGGVHQQVLVGSLVRAAEDHQQRLHRRAVVHLSGDREVHTYHIFHSYYIHTCFQPCTLHHGLLSMPATSTWLLRSTGAAAASTSSKRPHNSHNLEAVLRCTNAIVHHHRRLRCYYILKMPAS